MVETTNWEDTREKAAVVPSSVAEHGKLPAQHSGWVHSWKERETSSDGQFRDH